MSFILDCNRSTRNDRRFLFGKKLQINVRLDYEVRHVGSVGGRRQSNVVGAGDWPLSQVAVTGPGTTWAARAYVRPGDRVNRQAYRRGIV